MHLAIPTNHCPKFEQALTTGSAMIANTSRSTPLQMACTLVLTLFCTWQLQADDWPQWRGPNRDGVWRESGIIEAIPPHGLKVRWRARVGRGYSGPVVAEGRVFVTDYQLDPEVERVLCFDEATGKPLWTHSYPVAYQDMEYGNGPRASPTVHEGKVYTLGTRSHLFCLEASTGKVLWKKDLANEYDAAPQEYGSSVAPLIEGDLVIISAVCQPAPTVLAFDKLTGQHRWQALEDRPGYSAPILINHGGSRQAIIWTADSIASLEPTTGRIFWQIPYKATFHEAQVVASPVLHKDLLLCLSAWNRGSMMLTLDAEKPAASVLWKTRTRPTTQFSTPLFLDNEFFCGIDSVGGLCCLAVKSGDEVWRSTEVAGSSGRGHAHLTPNGNQVFLFNQRGQLISARLMPSGYEETGRTLLVEPTPGLRAQGPVTWAHPAYANKHVFARNDRELISASLDASQYPTTDQPLAKSEFESRQLSDFTGRNSALAIAFSQDSQTLALGTFRGEAKLVDLASGKEKPLAAPGIKNNCCAVAISPDGKLLVYAGGTEFKQIRNNSQTSGKVFLWDLGTQTPRENLAGHTSKVMAALFSPEGKTLATAGADQTIRLWNPATGQQLAVLNGHTDAVSSLAFLPDGKTLVSAGWDHTVKLWEVASGAQLASFPGHEEEILSLAISPTATTLATGSTDWTIRLWDLPTRKLRTVLQGHQGAVNSLAFSPDGKTLASGSSDETIKLWNVVTAQLRTTLYSHHSGISSLAFSPDNQTLATAGRDDPVRLWNLKPGKLEQTQP